MEKSEIETIYRKYFHDVFLYIRALSENGSLAEEITQETFLKAMNNIEKFDDGHSGETVTPKELIKKINGIRYSLYEDGTATIIQQDKEELSGDIVIPEKLTVSGNEYTVTGIAYPKNTASYGGLSSISAEGAAFQGSAITSIILPNTITSISSCAFSNCI